MSDPVPGPYVIAASDIAVTGSAAGDVAVVANEAADVTVSGPAVMEGSK